MKMKVKVNKYSHLPERKLTQEVRDAWVRALRSGKYKQARNEYCQISTNTKGTKVTHHCCLAVLDSVIGGPDAVKHSNTRDKTFGRFGGLTATQRRKFAKLNDDTEANFKLIADIVENKIMA